MIKLQLKKGQSDFFEEAVDYVAGNTNYRFLLLEGYAGTGKTFTICKVIEELLSKYTTNFQIAITAPTNKAVKVLRKSFPLDSRQINFITIHKLLGLKPKLNDDGTQEFVSELFSDNEIYNYNLIIVDEVSMLDDKIFAEINKTENIKVMFLGDGCQIPPVGKNDSIPLQPLLRDEYKIHHMRLTEIMRQSNENPIVDLSFYIRQNLSKDFKLNSTFNDKLIDDKLGVKFFPFSQQEKGKEIVGIIRKLFCSESFKVDADFAKVICWRNETVDTFNDRIRKMIYGKEIAKICIGEKLIADSPIIENNSFNKPTILFNTNDEFEVKSFETDIHAGFKIYKTTVEYETIKNEKKTKVIKILHEDDAPKFRNLLRKIKNEATEFSKRRSPESKKKWGYYYSLMQLFADVNYNYAITAHKSQGSSYYHVIVNEKDIGMNHKKMERNRILYTSVTRPREMLYLMV